MAIQLSFLCAVMTKRSIALNYPDGMPGFRQRYGSLREDQFLMALCAMSGGDLQSIVDELARNGLHVGQHVAVGDMWGGPFDDAPGINFVAPQSRTGGDRWAAEIADEDVTLENRPIRVTVRKAYPGETFLGGSGVIIPMRFDDRPKINRGSGPDDISMLAAHNAVEDGLRAGLAEEMGRREGLSVGPEDTAILAAHISAEDGLRAVLDRARARREKALSELSASTSSKNDDPGEGQPG